MTPPVYDVDDQHIEVGDIVELTGDLDSKYRWVGLRGRVLEVRQPRALSNGRPSGNIFIEPLTDRPDLTASGNPRHVLWWPSRVMRVVTPAAPTEQEIETAVQSILAASNDLTGHSPECTNCIHFAGDPHGVYEMAACGHPACWDFSRGAPRNA